MPPCTLTAAHTHALTHSCTHTLMHSHTPLNSLPTLCIFLLHTHTHRYPPHAPLSTRTPHPLDTRTSQGLAMVFTFLTSEPSVQAIAVTLLSIAYGFVHCIWQPLRNPASQRLQTVLLLCLAAVACSSPASFSAAAASAEPSPGAASTTARVIAEQLQTQFGVVLPLLTLAWAYVGPTVVGALGRCLPTGHRCLQWIRHRGGGGDARVAPILGLE
jgi:hypothetical protein